MGGINRKMIRKILEMWNDIGNKHFWGGIFDPRFYVANQIHNIQNETLLDIGSGTGLILHLAKADFKIGIELNMESIRLAKKFFPDLEIICGDIRKLPIKNNSFNTILSLHSISGFREQNDRDLVYNEIKRVCERKKSKIIFTLNNIKSIYMKKVPPEKRKGHIEIDELLKNFKGMFNLNLEGYNDHSKIPLFVIKIIVLKFPMRIVESLKFENIIYKYLKKQNETKKSRSFILTCSN